MSDRWTILPVSTPPGRIRAHLGASVLAVFCGAVAGCGGSGNTTPAPVQGSGQQEVHDCDTYAAHPGDVNRWAPGVSDDAIVPGPAVQRCSAAVSESSSTARFHFQLGRALLANARLSDALTSFKRADELGYCPAKFYLAEVALADGESAQKLDEAMKLFEAAGQCGFAPAIERFNEITFSIEGFEVPNVVQSLWDGDIETLNNARLTVALYLQGMHEFMAMDFHPVNQKCPALVARAAVTYDLDAAVAGDSKVGAVSWALLTSLLTVSPSVLKAPFDPVYFGDIEKFKTYFRGLGKRDGIYLIDAYGGVERGCTSPVTQHLYGQLLEFAKAKRPVESYLAELFPTTTKLFGNMGTSTKSQASPTPPTQ